MASCVTTYTSGGRTYFIAMTQPADKSTCTYLLINGVEFQKLNTLNDQSAVISQIQTNHQTLLNYQAQPFDLSQALAAFSFFFSAVMLMYFIAKSGGSVLETIRIPMKRN